MASDDVPTFTAGTDGEIIHTGHPDDPHRLRLSVVALRVDILHPDGGADEPVGSISIDAGMTEDGEPALWQIGPSTHPGRYRQANGYAEALTVAAEVARDMVAMRIAHEHADQVGKAAARLRSEFDDRLVDTR